MARKPVRKIDIHVHAMNYGMTEVFRIGGTRYATPAQLIEMYDFIGVDQGVILPEVFPESAVVMQPSEEAKRICDEYPGKFMWFANIDPRMGDNSPDTDLSYYIEHYKALGALGVGEVVYNEYADDPFMDNLCFHAAKCGVPITFHVGPRRGGCYGIIDDLGLPRIGRMLKKHKGLRFFGHSQPFWAEIGDDCTEENRNSYPTGKHKEGALVRIMRENPGLFGDMSAGSGFNAFARDEEFAFSFIEEFKTRLMFGTDFCYPVAKEDLGKEFGLSKWLDDNYAAGNIGEEAYYLICRGNAERELGLDKSL